MKNGDYRDLFVVGKIYKVKSNHWFYDIHSSKAWQFTNELFMLIETSVYYYASSHDPEEICQTEAKVLASDGKLLLLYAICPGDMELVEK
jgi:hypothetical protein